MNLQVDKSTNLLTYKSTHLQVDGSTNLQFHQKPLTPL